MIFTIFRDFFEFFPIFYLFNTFKINKKMTKGVLLFARVRMRRGTQGKVAAPRGPTRLLRGVFNDLYYIYIIYIVRVFSVPYIERVFILLNRRVS